MKTNRIRYGTGSGYFTINMMNHQNASLAFAAFILFVGFQIYHPIGSRIHTPPTPYSSNRPFLKGNRKSNLDTGGAVVGSKDGGEGKFDGSEYDEKEHRGEPREHDNSEPEIDEQMKGLVDGDHYQLKKELKLQKEVLKAAQNAEATEDIPIDVLGDSLSDSVNIAPTYTFDKHLMFHNYVKRKSGSVVEDMLMAHAYIFHQNATYGGCCGVPDLKMTAHEELLDALGLKGVLLFKCPRDYAADAETRRSVIPREQYHSDDTRVWTPEYVDYLRSLVTYPLKRFKEHTIVVHMQRGDTSPCRSQNNGFYRYLPNLHYQALIDKYGKPGARVIIYTSSKSFESLDGFRKRGYEVNTDASLKETWKDFVSADVMIMSRSDFSMVPAMVAKGTVVYTPFWHHALRRWKRVDRATMLKTDEETERLRQEKCS
jgi:hypothetical protein